MLMLLYTLKVKDDMTLIQIYISGIIISLIFIVYLYYKDFKKGISIFPIDIHDVGYLTVLSLTSWVGAIIIGGFIFDPAHKHLK